MKGPRALLDAEDHWVTSLGAFIPSEGRVVMHGKDLHHDLDELSWMDLLTFGITGRRFKPTQLELFQGLWKLAVSYPDPRIWNNRVAALCGTARSTPGLGVAGATATSDAAIYGQQPMVGAFDLLTRAKVELEKGETLRGCVLEALKRNRRLPGYGRPLRRRDERLDPAMRLAWRLGLADGQYTKLAHDIEQLLKPFRMSMNIAALSAALHADQGLSLAQYQRLTATAFTAGLIACEADAAKHQEGTLFPLSCRQLLYAGPSSRSWQDDHDRG